MKRALKRLWRKVPSLFRSIERWVAYRTYDKYHIVRTNLKPGYYDKDIILLHACFSLLKDYVEKELPGIYSIKTIDYIIAFFTNMGDLGTEEKQFWQTVKELYSWWTETRPNRKAPEEQSGLEEFIQTMQSKYGDLYYLKPNEKGFISLESRLSEDESNEMDRRMLLTNKIEQLQIEEDNLMLQKLFNIRLSLWT